MDDESVSAFDYLLSHGFSEVLAFNIALHALVTKMRLNQHEIKQAALELGYAVPELIMPLSLKDLN